MVANISHLKQPQHSPPNKEPANPHKYAWLFKTEPTRSAPAATIAVRSGINIPSPDDHSNSWESRAFAEDTSSFAAGIWPPRAYPCSFCRREFRSAQALGGHMNVHRRDRARLRHPSPPQGTFSTPITLPQHRSLFQAHDKCIGSPSVIYPNNSLIKLNSPAPISHSKYRDLPKTTPYASFTAGHCADNATSFPLRLQQLASEAAASLMYPQACDASDPLSVWPKSSTNSANFACHIPSMDGTPIKERAMEISSSSSLSSPPSSNISGARGQSAADTNRAPAIPPEDESPYKKSHTESNSCNYPFSHILKIVNSLKDGLHEHDNQLSSSKTATNGVANAERGSKACSGRIDVDLELRLGQNPA